MKSGLPAETAYDFMEMLRAAEEKLEKKVSEWVGHEVTPEDIEKLAE